MDARRLQDRINWGLNRTARFLGLPTDAYRPDGPRNPLRAANRYLRLHAAFSKADGDFDEAVPFGVPLWRGHFDGAYTRPGDYLVQDGNIWFIAAQQSLLPILCVKTNATISIGRPVSPDTGTTYGTTSPNLTEPLISEWPVCISSIGGGQQSPSRLPSDSVVSHWTVIMPRVPESMPRISDIVTDANQTNGTIFAIEPSDLGLRLYIRQATT